MTDPATAQTFDKSNLPHYGRKKPYQGREDNLQIGAANILRMHRAKPLFTHVANERKTTVRQNSRGGHYTPEGNKLAAMGVLKGVADLLIFEPVHTYAGLVIELKAKGGSLKKDQRNFLLAMQERGFHVAVCWNLDAVKAVADNYLSARFHWFTTTTL